MRRRRFLEARRAGLTIPESRLFADSDTDIGLLRNLVDAGCPLRLLAAIVI